MELGVVVPANLHPYLSDRSYLAPLAPEFDQVYNLIVDRFKSFLIFVLANQKGLFLSMTVPAVCVLMVVIVSLILAFSLAHWFAYHDTVNRDKLFQERYQQI